MRLTSPSRIAVKRPVARCGYKPLRARDDLLGSPMSTRHHHDPTTMVVICPNKGNWHSLSARYLLYTGPVVTKCEGISRHTHDGFTS